MSFICKAPWVSIAFQPNGVAPCCVFDLSKLEKFSNTQDLFQDIRQTFKLGKIPTGCNKCKQTWEYSNKKPPAAQAFDHYDTDFEKISIQEINLKSNNFCNLACRSCGPHFSSKWEEEFKGTIVITKDTNVINKLSQIDLTTLKTIVFAGGEPTLVPEHVYLLKKLLEINYTTPSIRIATNLHNLNYKGTDLIALWKQFPNLYLNVSIDAVGDRARFIRSGTDWETMCSNLTTILENNLKHYVSLTVSALNIWFLEETMDYLDKHFNNTNRVSFNMLIEPDILNISVIPNEFREKLNNMLDRCLVKGYRVDNIKEYLNFNDNSTLWQSFLIYNLLLDATRKEQFCQSLPIFDSLIDQWVKL